MRFLLLLTLLLTTLFEARAQSRWTRLDGPYGGAVGSIAIDDEGRLFAATAWEIYRSLDSGASWHPLAIGAISASRIHLAATGSAVVALLDSASFSTAIRSTDGGGTWRPADAGLPVGYWIGVGELAIDSASGALYGALGDGVYRSSDGGARWTRISTIQAAQLAVAAGTVWTLAGNRIHRLAAASGFDTVAVALEAGSVVSSMTAVEPGVLLVSSARDQYTRGIYRTTDDGRTWLRVGRETPVLYPDRRGAALAVGDSLVLVSVDGYIRRASSWVAPYRIADIRRAADGTIWAGSSRGVLRSDDDGATWRRMNHGLRGTAVEKVSAIGDVLVARTPESLVWSGDAGRSWREIEYRFDRNPWTTQFAHTADGVIYRGLAEGTQGSSTLSRSLDSGRTWSLLETFETSHFLAAVVAADSIVLAVVGPYLHVSTDRGDTWLRTNPGGGTPSMAAIDSGGAVILVTAMNIMTSQDGGRNWWTRSVSATPTRIDAAWNDDLYVRSNLTLERSRGGAEFVRVNDPGQYYGHSGIIVDATGAIMATSGSVRRSTDDGVTWRDASDGLDRHTVATIGSGGDRVYVGTRDAGIYVREYRSSGIAPHTGIPDRCDVRLSALGRSLLIAGDAESLLRVTLHDPLGRTVASYDVAPWHGAQTIALPPSAIAAGYYFARLVSDECTAVVPFVVGE